MTRGPIGILMLDTRFPRPVGDIGNPDSFDCPAIYRRIPGASARDAVHGDTDTLVAPFVAAGRELVAAGARVVGTSCGFLSPLQAAMQDALPVPVVCSALGLAARSDRRCGILTIDADALTGRHLAAAGILEPLPMAGLRRDGELSRVIFGDLPELDMQKAEAEMIRAADELIATDPSLETIVFECTNMGPYARAVAAATGRQVRTVIDALQEALP